jgi:glycosyltransferase involved in cell wall biosynthesis
MKIIHVSTSDTTGGAARAAYRLHTGLRDCGQDSSMWVARRSSNEATVMSFRPPEDFPGRLRAFLRRAWITGSLARYGASRPPEYGLFSSDRTRYGSEWFDQLPPCDVFNLHWVAGFLDYEEFFGRVARHTPVIWTLHDMNPFTGGCHVDDYCGKYVRRCGACPQLGSTATRDLSRRTWLRKRRIFERIKPGRLHIVTPSRWLARECERSSLLARFPVSVIPNSVDVDNFTPRDRCFARDLWGIPQDAKVILFVAHGVSVRYKGFNLLTQALCGLGGCDDVFLLSAGARCPTPDIGLPHLHLGHIGNDRALSLAYGAADLFVIPSLQDNLPNTVLEAMACGIPIVGFSVGGIPDMARPGVNGLLAPPGDVAKLRDAILQLLADETVRAAMSVNCRRIAEEEYGREVQVRRYVELYRSLVDR